MAKACAAGPLAVGPLRSIGQFGTPGVNGQERADVPVPLGATAGSIEPVLHAQAGYLCEVA